MMNIAKILSILMFSATLLAGCIHSGYNNEPKGNYYQSPTNTPTGTAFNEEVYVWETFIFSTNRVEKTR